MMQDSADTKPAYQSRHVKHRTIVAPIDCHFGNRPVCGWVLRFVGQPAVIGEMIAGLLLGPVVFGALFPQLRTELFPKPPRGPVLAV
jgi:hypothetical protein